MANLADVSEVFKDADSEHPLLCDPIWWSEFSQIDKRRLKDRDSREYRNVMLILFEVIFVAVVVVMFVPLMFWFSQSSEVPVIQEAHRDFWRFDPAMYRTSDSFWSWANESLVPSLLGAVGDGPPIAISSGSISTSFASNEFSHASPALIVPETDMVLVGAVRLRQLRVSDAACRANFAYRSASLVCQSDFNSGWTDSRSDFSSPECPSYLKSAFSWAEDAGAPMTSSETALKYPSDGFSVLLPATEAQARSMLKDLRDWNWIDPLTAAIIVEVTGYHGSSNFFAFDRFLFEFSSSNTPRAEYQLNVIPANTVSFSLSGGKSLFALDVLNLIFFSVCLVTFVLRFFATGPRLLVSWWTYLDTLILALQWTYTGMRVSLYSITPTESFGDPKLFAGITSIIPLFGKTLEVQSVLFLFLAIRACKFSLVIGFGVPESFRRILKASIGPTLIAFILVCGFGFAYHIAVGYSNPLFALKANSFAVAGVSLLSVVWATELSGIGAFLTSWYIWLVYVVLVPVLLVMTLRTGTDEPKIHRENALVVALRHSVEMVNGQTQVEMIDMADTVPVRSLPEVVRNRIFARRKQVHGRVEATFGFAPIGYSELNDSIDKTELQRLIDSDSFVPKVLGTSDPSQVIRIFTQEDQPLLRLQAAVDKKIQVLQKTAIDLDLSVDPQVDGMSMDVQAAIAKVEKQMQKDVVLVTQASRDVSELVNKVNDQFAKLRRRRDSQSSASSSGLRK